MTLTEPQVWVLMGIFSAAIFGMIGIITTSFNRNLTTSLHALRDVMDARFEKMDMRFEMIETRFEMIETRFDSMNVKLDALDRDVQALTRHVFGADPRP